MTKSEMIKRAEKWLRNTERCEFVCIKRSALTYHPDLIGYKSNGVTVVVECRSSMDEFLKDRKSWLKKNDDKDRTMGVLRYYFAPKNVLSSDDMPDGWGLIEPFVENIRTIKVSAKRAQTPDILAREFRYLISSVKHIKTFS